MTTETTTETTETEHIAVLGDVHGHLLLALTMLARWQRELGKPFTMVLLCGDIGSFTDFHQLDSATRSHARNNPCELEFIEHWSRDPQPEWVHAVFQPEPDGLGLSCPVVMTHGNHEGFEHLATLDRRRRPSDAVLVEELLPVDPGNYLRYLPSGWRLRTPWGRTIGAIGGIEPGQRRAKYHPMAYIDDDAVLAICDGPPLDILITHQGPTRVQGGAGAPSLDVLLELDRPPSIWCHGHATPVLDVVSVDGKCTVVPLGDIAFAGRGAQAGPGLDGWGRIAYDGRGVATVSKETPPFWRELRQHRWLKSTHGLLVPPDLARWL